MKLIRPFAIGDSALISSNIGEDGSLECSGDFSGAVELSGDISGTVSLSGDLAGQDEWGLATLYAEGDQVLVTDTDYHHTFEALSGGTSQTVTITIASPGVVSWTAHGLAADTPITFTTTDTLPTGLTAGTIYYVVAIDGDTFSVAASSGGSAIDTTGTQSGTHTAIANPNLNKVPRDNPDFWLDMGASNRWAMFDQYNTSQSTSPDMIQVEIATTGPIDALALLNISAAEVTVVSETEADGEVFNETYSMVSTFGITDWYAYFFEDIVRRGDLVVQLPPYVAQTVTVTLTAPGESVKAGNLILGRAKDIGATIYGASTGITDYSRKDTDAFGNYTIVERAFSKRGEFKVWTDTTRIEDIQNVLTGYRATPIVYIGSGDFANTQIFGFYKNFDLEITGPYKSYCTLEIEGLT